MPAVSEMSSSAAVYEVTSEHARITQQEAPDYFSIPWNDDFSTNFFVLLLLCPFVPRSVGLWHLPCRICSGGVANGVDSFRFIANVCELFNVPCLKARRSHES